MNSNTEIESVLISSGNASDNVLFYVIVFNIIVFTIYFLRQKLKGSEEDSDKKDTSRKGEKENISSTNASKLSEEAMNNGIDEGLISYYYGMNVKTNLKTQVNSGVEQVKKANPAVIITKPIVNQTKEVTKPITKLEVETSPQVKKYIGYNPINVFAQSEPLFYPYVIMPNPGSVIMFPRKGRKGRKGYKEDEFKNILNLFFKESHQLYDDRFILVKNMNKPYEPDFTIIDEKLGLNLFLDIEIDEPYEGINNIESRKPTHYQFADVNRNNAFKNRGWVVIRFAEIQLHQEPIACCRFIADVINSINPNYSLPQQLLDANQVSKVKQWTKLEAEIWSKDRYREKYLQIEKFGIVNSEFEPEPVSQTEMEKRIEEEIKDEPFVFNQEKLDSYSGSINNDIIKSISAGQFLSIEYGDSRTIINPFLLRGNKLNAYCYIKNREIEFDTTRIKKILIKPNYYTQKIIASKVGIDGIKSAVNKAILYKKYVRMQYTRSSWSTMDIDKETGEVIIRNIIEQEESIRTIDNIQMAIKALSEEKINYYRLNENYITAYCNKREEERTFKFDRIGEVEILDL